jgi:predicted MFS family arabinose efflux permease
VTAAEGRAVWMLALGQTLAYACIFYIFAALVVEWQAALGWDKAVLAAGPTLAVLISAGLAPLVGRAVDRGYGRELMVLGPVLGALALTLLALAQGPSAYLLAWAGLGVAQSLCLYEVCFAILIRRFGAGARPAITRVTLVAGLASTLAFPAAAALAGAFGWRGAVAMAAVVMIGLVAPLHWIGAGALAAVTAPVLKTRRAVVQVLRRAGFWVLAAVFSLTNLNHWMLISFLLPVLMAQGLGNGLAITAASLIGPSQVVGRLILMRFETRAGTVPSTLVILSGMCVAALLLALAGAGAAFALVFALVQGAAMGGLTILRPVLVAETLGSEGYGATAGLLSIPSLVASAAAPLLGAALLEAGGPALMIGAAFGMAALALVLAAAAVRRR